MLRVLVIAEAANPEMVSVPLVGWSIANALREVADVHIVTQIRNREAFLRAGLTEGVDFTAIDSERVARPLHRITKAVRGGKGKGWTTAQVIAGISYKWFEYLVWRKFRLEIEGGTWDVVHRVTPLSPTIPSSIAKRCRKVGIPFVLGPINGGVPWPSAFDSARRAEKEWLSYVRGVYKLLPGRKRTLSAASAILVGSRFTESEIPIKHRVRCVYLPENAIDRERFNLSAAAGAELGPLRLCFVGRLVPYKGVDMLLEAATPLLREGRIRIDIVGDGPIAKDLDLMIAEGEINDAVTRHGWMAHRDVQSVMAKCDALAFPSIREFGGGVVLEAMALGLPPIVVNYAGPGELVDEKVGYVVPIGTRKEIVCDLSTLLQRMTEDRSSLITLGRTSKDRVRDFFTWQRKAEQILEVYDWVLNRRKERPDPFKEISRGR